MTLLPGVRLHHRVPPAARLGRAGQLDPVKPTLKASGIKRLKLEHDGLLSNFGFKFNLRRYTSGTTTAGALIRFCSAEVGLCRLTLSNPP
jgi:hypothetical protein